MVCFHYAGEDGLVTDRNVDHYSRVAAVGRPWAHSREDQSLPVVQTEMQVVRGQEPVPGAET